MSKSYCVVNTFANDSMQGTPVSVFLPEKLNKNELKHMAAEMNTPETIFLSEKGDDFEAVVFSGDKKGNIFGNSLFGAACALVQNGITEKAFELHVENKIYPVKPLENENIEIGFPRITLQRVPAPDFLFEALQNEMLVSVNQSENNLIVETRNPKRLEQLQPRMDLLNQCTYDSLVITSDTHYETDLDYDYIAKVYVSSFRNFKDMTTAVTHQTLALYWSERQNKTNIIGYCPIANSGTFVKSRIENDRIWITGKCCVSSTGKLLAA